MNVLFAFFFHFSDFLFFFYSFFFLSKFFTYHSFMFPPLIFFLCCRFCLHLYTLILSSLSSSYYLLYPVVFASTQVPYSLFVHFSLHLPSLPIFLVPSSPYTNSPLSLLFHFLHQVHSHPFYEPFPFCLIIYPFLCLLFFPSPTLASFLPPLLFFLFFFCIVSLLLFSISSNLSFSSLSLPPRTP